MCLISYADAPILPLSPSIVLHTVHLTQTGKKTREHKARIVNDVKEAIDEHDTLYLFSYENMRSDRFKDVRLHFRDEVDGKSSRIFLGKNKLLQLAMGRTPEDEHAENLRKVAALTSGSVGLLATSRPNQEVESYFADMVEEDFARAGATAPKTVSIPNELVGNFPSSMMEQFRKLGMPVEVKNGRVSLVGGVEEYRVCKEGQILSAEACKILHHFGYKLAEFRVKLVCKWNATSCKFQKMS